ncbi:MAG: divergent polysaccharide deacetylase family protein, partial [Nitrospinota bacterium]
MAREDNKVAKTTKWLFGALAVFALVLTLFILFFVLTQQGHILRKKEKTTVGEQKNSPKPPQKEISKVAPPEQTRPRVAIIIDDLGWNYTLALRLLKMDADFSFSILPNLKYSVKIAEEANKLNREILLHVPMESHENFKEFAPISPLRTTMNTEETQSVLSAYLRAVPYVKGINNHMGSKFTENEEGMKTVLLFLREKSLFFVDSLTTPKSVAYVLARKLGVQTARRTVFFDND